ncbi:hypothetical protein G6F37_011149 [Rhizopus arrhizus]|nr:hypothetical protein G6F38_011238 [Rhizopus arrhizus]KAG1150660.1 hypothetical protein G6F37_011149 [Rhizopus arrhizus]
MNPSQPPPQLPAGWIALWDESSQRYYYLEQATGRTQWELPTQPSSSFNTVNGGESSSYQSSYAQSYSNNSPAVTSYPTQQTYPYPTASDPNSPYPSNNPGVEGQDRGLGNVFKGYGGAVAGGLIGFAAGKFLGNHHHGNNHHQNGGYYPPPPPPSQGFGGFLPGFGGHNQHHNHHNHFF